MIIIKNIKEIGYMRNVGKLAAETLKLVGSFVKVGTTTNKLNFLAEEFILKKGALPSFKGYNGFPAIICTSINEEVVHGIPSERELVEGDIVSIDVGVYLNGFHADVSATFAVGEIPFCTKQLLQVTKKSLYKGIYSATAGNRIGDISYSIQSYCESFGYGIVKDMCGHGIGRNLHEEPEVPNFGKCKTGVKLIPGMTLAIEPMVNMGKDEIEVLDDNWTVVTKDYMISAHFEHTILITENEPEILTIS